MTYKPAVPSREYSQLRIVKWSSFGYLQVLAQEEHHLRTINPLPIDCKLVRVGHDEVGNINILVSSSTFKELEEGEEIPEHLVQFEKIYENNNTTKANGNDDVKT